MLASAAGFVAVMDADLQHDEIGVAADARNALKAGRADLVVGSFASSRAAMRMRFRARGA